MRVLLSAYACEPNQGSELETGWRWAIEIARLGHHVSVLTLPAYRVRIEKAISREPDWVTIDFHYCDLARITRLFMTGEGDYNRLHFFCWQFVAYHHARRMMQRGRYDLVHHITIGDAHVGSLLGRLGVPFVYGPVGGGQRVPLRLRTGFHWRGWLVDLLRDTANHLVLWDPFLRTTYAQAALIYLKNSETQGLVPKKNWPKTKVQLDVGIDLPNLSVSAQGSRNAPRRILFVGRFVHWKGADLALRTIERVVEQEPDVGLTVVGEGPELHRLQALARHLRVERYVRWQAWMRRERLLKIYEAHDILLYPSLRDSSGHVMVEAIAHGLPVVCLDLGGPGAIVDARSGCVVATAGKGVDQVVSELAAALLGLIRVPQRYAELRRGAVERAQSFRWAGVVGQLYGRSGDVTRLADLGPTR